MKSARIVQYLASDAVRRQEDKIILGCFIFSPFLKLKMLGVVSDRVFDADFEYVIFISL